MTPSEPKLSRPVNRRGRVDVPGAGISRLIAGMEPRGWRDRGAQALAANADAVAPVWPVLAKLEVYTPDRRLLGWIAPEGERASDWMNRGQEVELLAAVELGLAGDAPDLPQPQVEAPRFRLPSLDVLFAVPPSLPQGRHLRLHRRVVRISFEVGDYDLSGRIHVAPGADPGENLLRSTRTFVPITDAELIHHAEPPFTRSFSTLIVNARNVSRVHVGESSSRRSFGPAQQVVPTHPAAEPSAGDWPESLGSIEPVAGAIHRALSELAALHRDGLIDDSEFEAKRSEILARL
jgi:hypothetical protein